MKNWFLGLAFLSVATISCSKSDKNCGYTDVNASASASEITTLQNYITANSISATQHSSGLFYTIDEAGTGNTASVCSNITVNYTGTLISSGTVFFFFFSTSGINFVLGQLIVGWQKGLPLIKAGGKITLYVPPSLGYGAFDKTDGNGNVVIPGNSYLKFSISLLYVQ